MHQPHTVSNTDRGGLTARMCVRAAAALQIRRPSTTSTPCSCTTWRPTTMAVVRRCRSTPTSSGCRLATMLVRGQIGRAPRGGATACMLPTPAAHSLALADAVSRFIEYALKKPDVWFVTYQDLIHWMKVCGRAAVAAGSRLVRRRLDVLPAPNPLCPAAVPCACQPSCRLLYVRLARRAQLG